MAFTVSDALREMAENAKKASTTQKKLNHLLESGSKETIVRSRNPVDQFLIPEGYTGNSMKHVGYVKARYYDLKEKFKDHASFPPNPITTDAYAFWEDVNVTEIEVDDYDDNDKPSKAKINVTVEVIFYDKYNTEVGKMYNNDEVVWEVFCMSSYSDYIDQIRARLGAQYKFSVLDKNPNS